MPLEMRKRSKYQNMWEALRDNLTEIWERKKREKARYIYQADVQIKNAEMEMLWKVEKLMDDIEACQLEEDY